MSRPIRQRISIAFTLLTGAILLVFAAFVYVSSTARREALFYQLLRQEALSKASLFLEAKMPAATLQEIHRRTYQMVTDVEVAIYVDSAFTLLYHDDVKQDRVKETPDMLDSISDGRELSFYLADDWQVVGLRYVYAGHEYLITATAYDRRGYNSLRSLMQNMGFIFLASMGFIYAAGRYFSRKAFQPVVEMSEQAHRITARDLHLRLPEAKNKEQRDEVEELTHTFNLMLDRLAASFAAQSQFVAHLSHEIRTPLAAIIAELELSTLQERSNADYLRAIAAALNDAQRLSRLSTNLLNLAKAHYDPSTIAFRPLRADEILLEAQQQLQKAQPRYHIELLFSDNSDDEEPLLLGNEYLLRLAMLNLLENGCKFSSPPACTVALSVGQGQISVDFLDEGIGISAEDAEHLFTPFFRASNAQNAEGNGIGLALSHKIAQLHKGSIAFSPRPHGGSRFSLRLPLYNENIH